MKDQSKKPHRVRKVLIVASAMIAAVSIVRIAWTPQGTRLFLIDRGSR